MSFRVTPLCITGLMGESFYKLSELSHDVNYDHKCRQWYGNEADDADQMTETLSCPCNVAMAAADARWRPDGVKYPDDKTCFYERMPVDTSTQVGGNCSRGSLIRSYSSIL